MIIKHPSEYAALELLCVECGGAPETGFEPDPAVSRCPTCGGTEFDLFQRWDDTVPLPRLRGIEWDENG